LFQADVGTAPTDQIRLKRNCTPASV